MVGRKFLIVRRSLPLKFTKLQYMMKDHRVDYLGQIIIQLGYNPDNARIPSEIGEEIPYLTCEYRGRILDTEITHEILRLDSLPREQQEQRLGVILGRIGAYVEFE